MIPGTSLLISLKPRLNKPNRLETQPSASKIFAPLLTPRPPPAPRGVVVVPPPRSHIVSRLAVWSRCLSRLYDFHSKSFLGTITMKSVAARASPTSLSEATPDQLNRCARPPSPEVLLSPLSHAGLKKAPDALRSGASPLHLRPADLLPTSECLGIP